MTDPTRLTIPISQDRFDRKCRELSNARHNVKKLKEQLADARQREERLLAAIRRWAQSDAEVAALPEEAYLNPAQMDDLTAALGRKRAAAANLHTLAVNHHASNEYSEK